MKKVFFILATVICSGLYGQKDKSYICHRHESGIDDFKSTTSEFQYSDKVKLAYCISNDDENIYIDLLITNNAIMREVYNSGITIWISNDGKKAKKLGVKYPVSERNVQGRSGPGAMGNQQGYPGRPGGVTGQNAPPAGNPQRAMGGQPNAEGSSLQLIGFNESGPVDISTFEEGSFRGSIRIERDQNMYYEVILPISKLPELHDQPSGKDKQGSFLIGIAYKDISASMSYGAGGGGAGGARGGGGGGSRSGGMSRGPAPASEAQLVFWIEDIRLAAKN